MFALRGTSATLEEVATRAGVGVGTVHRRFGSKDALIEAVFDRRLDAAVDALTRSLAAPTAGEGLRALLHHAVQRRDDAAAPHALLSLDVVGMRFDRLRERIVPLLTELVDRARAEGAVRDDFAAADVPVIVFTLGNLTTSHPTIGPQLAQRYLELLLLGAQPHGEAALVAPPASDAQLAVWFAALAHPS